MTHYLLILIIYLPFLSYGSDDWKSNKSKSIAAKTAIIKRTSQNNNDNKKNEKEDAHYKEYKALSDDDKKRIKSIIDNANKKRKRIEEKAVKKIEEAHKPRPRISRIFRTIVQKVGIEDQVDDIYDFYYEKYKNNERFIKYVGGAALITWFAYRFIYKKNPVTAALEAFFAQFKVDKFILDQENPKLDKNGKITEENGNISNAGLTSFRNLTYKVANDKQSTQYTGKYLSKSFEHALYESGPFRLLARFFLPQKASDAIYGPIDK